MVVVVGVAVVDFAIEIRLGFIDRNIYAAEITKNVYHTAQHVVDGCLRPCARACARVILRAVIKRPFNIKDFTIARLRVRIAWLLPCVVVFVARYNVDDKRVRSSLGARISNRKLTKIIFYPPAAVAAAAVYLRSAPALRCTAPEMIGYTHTRTHRAHI